MTTLELVRRSRQFASRKQVAILCFCTALLTLLALPRVQKKVSAAGAKKTATIWLQEPHNFAASYQGKSEAVQSLSSGQVEPLSLTSADFNEDGMADLGIGYGTANGGLLVVHPGNLDAVSPQSLESWKAIAAGNFPPAFAENATVVPLPHRPDFLTTAKTTAGSHADLLAAARNGKLITVLAGDGHGSFSPAQTITVPGAITALAAGEFGRHGAFSHVLVGVNGPKQSFLMLYAGSETGLALQSRFVLPAPPVAIALGDVDGDAFPDAAILAGGQMFVLHSLAANGKPALEPLNLPVSASAFALGRFVFDRDPRLQMALLAPDGAVHIVVHSAFDPRFWTAEELKDMQNNRTRPRTTQKQASLEEGWTVAESMAGVSPFSDFSNPPLLVSARISGYGQDDVVALNRETAQLIMLSHPNLKLGDVNFTPAEVSVRAYTGGAPIATTTMRVNADGRKGMVALHQGKMGPFVMEPLPDPTFVVNTTADTVDANPGDGKCADAQGNCSLRAAVIEANADAGADTIVVPAGTFTLSILPNGLGNASGGHLDITDGISIVGASPSTTIIQASLTAGNGIDKVFSINPNGTFPSFDTLLSNMTVEFGKNSTDAFGGAFDWDAGTNGTGNITLSSVNLNSNSNPASSSDGGGALFSNIAGGTTGTVTITNSTIQHNSAQDGGGGIWVGSTVPVAISNTQFTNNVAMGTGAQTGGGILIFGPSGASQSAIHASTISGNQAGVQGGGIYTTEGLLIDQGTIINGNHSGGDGGGLWNNLTVDTTTIKNSTITSNSAVGNGGGIEVDNNTFGNNLSITFSRIVGNSAGTGSGLNNISGSVTATDNWWGCNAGPGAAPCDLITGVSTTSSSPWITLTNAANPTSITTGASTTLTASLLQDSNNGTISASNLGAFVGVPITFSNPVNGTLSNVQNTIQSTGTATATLTATAGPTASATATMDHASVTASVAVGGFTIAISPSSQSVLVGNSVSYTVTVAPVGSFSGTVTLSASGCPANTTCSLSTTSIANASGTATLNVATTPSTPTTSPSFTLTVTGTSGNSTATGTAALITQDFAPVKVSPTTQTTSAGGSVAATVSITRTNGFNGSVALSASGLPAGAAASFTPNPISSRSSSSSMTITTSTTTPPGNYSVTITGSSGGQLRTTTFNLVITNFTVTVSAPTSVTVTPGNTATYSVVVAPVNGFTGSVNLTVTGLPAGATGSFSVNPVNITSGSVISTLTVTTTAGTTPAATSNLTITGAGANNLNNSASATLVVQDFSITPPSLACIKATQTVSGPVTLMALNGFSGSLNLSISGLPAGASTNFSPNPVNVSGTNAVTSTLTITTAANTPGGNYTLTITASGTDANTNTVVNKTTTTTLCVQSFTVAMSPSSQTINAGAPTSYTVTVNAVNGYTGTVNLSQTGLPSGATGTFNPASLTFTSSSATQQTSILQVATTSALAGNNYNFTVSGTDANLAALVQSVQGSLNIKNFTLSIDLTTQSVIAGQSTSYKVTATPVNGYTGTLNCTVTGLAAGETVQSCPNITISGTSPVQVTVTINTSPSTGPTNVNLNINYKDTTGNPSQNKGTNLITEDFSIIVSPSLVPADLNSPAGFTVTVSPLNGFTGTINISCSVSPSGPTFSTPCPTSLTITNGNPVSANFAVLASQSNSIGRNYSITATGTSAVVPSLSHTSAPATLQAEDYTLSLSPMSQNVIVGNSVNYTITATSVNGFSGTIFLTCSGTLAGANVTCPPSIVVSSGGSNTATLTVATSGSTVAGSFSINVSGSGGGVNHSGVSAGITVTDQRALNILGSVNSALGSTCCFTFSVTVNNFTANATYCECVLNGQFQDNPAALVSQLVTAFGASGSPVNASGNGSEIVFTAKSPGVVLSMSSADGGNQGGGLSGLSFLAIPVGAAQGTIRLAITGSIASSSPAESGTPEPFSVTVNGFATSANYCECLIGGKIIDNPTALASALASAFNSASGSPVTATTGTDSSGNALLILTSKSPNAPLSGVIGVDGNPQPGGMGGYSFLAAPE